MTRRLLRHGPPLVALAVVAVLGQDPEPFAIDPAASDVTVHVGRAGLAAFAGHEHRIVAPVRQGEVTLDWSAPDQSHVWVEFDAAAFRVIEEGEPPEDVPEVQRVMLSERVLDVEQHPTLRFASTSVTVVERSAGALTVRVAGDLTLRGVTRPVSISLDVRLTDGALAAEGTTTVRQSDFGIEPVTAGLGLVRVADEVEVTLSMSARRR